MISRTSDECLFEVIKVQWEVISNKAIQSIFTSINNKKKNKSDNMMTPLNIVTPSGIKSSIPVIINNITVKHLQVNPILLFGVER